MSENLFLDPANELQRMESLLRANCKSYFLSIGEQLVPPVGRAGEGRTFYFASITYVSRKDGHSATVSFDGDSLPDLYSKVADNLQTI